MVFKNIRLKKCKGVTNKGETTTTMTESSIAYHCINFLKSEEIKKEMSNIINPIMDYFLKQIHIYLYFFFIFYIY